MLYLFIGIPLAILAFIVIPHTLLEESYHQRRWVDVVGYGGCIGFWAIYLFTQWQWANYAMMGVLLMYLAAKYYINKRKP